MEVFLLGSAVVIGCESSSFWPPILIVIFINFYISSFWSFAERASLMAQQVKNLPAMQETQETWVQSLGREDALEKEIATHSSILAWEIQTE